MSKFIDVEVQQGKMAALVNQNLKNVLGQLDAEQVEAVQAYLLFAQLELDEELILRGDDTSEYYLAGMKRARKQLKIVSDGFVKVCKDSRKAQGMEAIV